jgi:transcriptional regulator with XRE-family HTH domain
MSSRMSKPAHLIRAARDAAGLTQSQASAASGYSISAIQKFEAGRRTPPARAIQPLLAAITNARP